MPPIVSEEAGRRCSDMPATSAPATEEVGLPAGCLGRGVLASAAGRDLEEGLTKDDGFIHWFTLARTREEAIVAFGVGAASSTSIKESAPPTSTSPPPVSGAGRSKSERRAQSKRPRATAATKFEEYKKRGCENGMTRKELWKSSDHHRGNLRLPWTEIVDHPIPAMFKSWQPNLTPRSSRHL